MKTQAIKIASLLFLIPILLFQSCTKELPPAPSKSPLVLNGVINSPLTLKSENSPYILDGYVFVRNTVLTIEQGTVIKGKKGSRAALIIERGAKIKAEGTQEYPIVFTSDQPIGKRQKGDWGGVVINGYAKINGAGVGEYDTGLYGGNDQDDDSGILRYIRIEFAGARKEANTELNGLSLQGVGRKTIIDHIQVHRCMDDGFEFFGGAVDAKYLLSTWNEDDSFDWVEGWVGRGQFWICQQKDDVADNGIEGSNANNTQSNYNIEPYSNPTLYNLTLIGNPSPSSQSKKGIRLDRGTRVTIRNSIIMGFGQDAIFIPMDDSMTHNLAIDGSLSIKTTIVNENSPNLNGLEETTGIDIHVSQTSPIDNPYDFISPDFRSQGDATGVIKPEVPTDTFFNSVSYIGAMGQDNWTSGWITLDEN